MLMRPFNFYFYRIVSSLSLRFSSTSFLSSPGSLITALIKLENRATPAIIEKILNNISQLDVETTSPYPTVATVWMAHYHAQIYSSISKSVGLLRASHQFFMGYSCFAINTRMQLRK